MIIHADLTIAAALVPDKHGLSHLALWLRPPVGPEQSGHIAYDSMLGELLDLPEDPRHLTGSSLHLVFTGHYLSPLTTSPALFDLTALHPFDLYVDWLRAIQETVVSYHPQLEHRRYTHAQIRLRSNPLRDAGPYLYFVLKLKGRQFRHFPHLPPGPVFSVSR